MRNIGYCILACSDIGNNNFLQHLFFEQLGNPVYHGASDLQFYRQMWILVGNVDARTDDDLDRIAFE